jgi:uncharacterized membrane protein YgdD (TMEM256/DUF423 family)
MLLPIVIILAGLMGAAGVMLAAASAHVAPGSGLDSAAYMLLFHASAVLGVTALRHQRLICWPAAVFALTAWIVGAALFSGDIAARAFVGHRLFPMAAPSGGTLLIVGWVAVAVGGVVALICRDRS